MRALDKFGSAFLRLLFRRMKELGLNQSALARRMKCSRAYVSKVLSGDVSFTFATAIRFCRALELDFIPSASSSPSTSTSSLDLSPSPSPYRFSVVLGSDLREDDFSELSRVFSDFYGRWSASAPAPYKAGERIRMSASRYRDWYANDAFRVARCYRDEKLVGHAIYLNVTTSRGRVAFVVQLVVDEEHRHRGIAKTLLHAAFGFSDYYAWAIVTSSPCTIAALEAATFRRGNLARMVENADFIRREVFSQVPFLSKVEPEIDVRGSCVNSAFFTDRTTKQPGTDDAIARYGLLPEGYEWLAVVFRDQEPDDLDSLGLLVNQSGEFVRAAYRRMPQERQPWSQKADEEVAAILRALPELPKAAKICDFGAGCGRHIEAFRNAGFRDVSGIDFALPGPANTSGVVAADCRTWTAKKKFDLIVCLYDVIGSFSSDAENDRIIGNVAANLKKGGYAVLSVANAEFSDKRNVTPVSADERPAFLRAICKLDPSNAMSSDGEFFSRPTLWDRATGLFYHKEQFDASDVDLPAEYLVVDRRYTADEIIAKVERAGLTVLNHAFVRAGFSKSFTRTTGKEILLFCQKGAVR